MSDVLLRDDLRAYLRGRYGKAGITPLEIECTVAKLNANVGFSLYENNLHTYRLMVEWFSLKSDDNSLPNLYVEPIDLVVFHSVCLE